MTSMMELRCDGLEFPTSLAFDDRGRVTVAESGLDAQGRPGAGRILRIDDEGRRTCLRDDLGAPINGLTFDARAGCFHVAEGGPRGRVLSVDVDGGSLCPVVEDLPGGGSYHTNMVAVGDDGWLYFGQAAATNSGVIDVGAVRRGSPRILPPDIPGMTVELSGQEWHSEGIEIGTNARTGGFCPFGEVQPAGTRLSGQVPCTAAVLRCRPDGSGLELFAWGLRNAYGLGFVGGRLLALELGPNDRGPRPIGCAPSCLYAVEPGSWYGWPDFVAGVRVDDARYTPKRGQTPRLLLANHDELPAPPAPLLRFPLHAAPVKFAAHPGPGPRTGELFVALFGDKKPFTAPPGPAAGRAVARVTLAGSSPGSASLYPFISESLHRPIDLAFDPRDRSLWILDFGDYEVEADASTTATASTGRLWRVPAEVVDTL